MSSPFSFFSRLVRVPFPEKYVCAVCGRETFSGGWLCEECEAEIPVVGAKYCVRCGSATLGDVLCENCKIRLPAFDIGRSVYRYEPPADRLIRAFKYGGKKYLARFFGEKLDELFRREKIEADAVAFVPMSRKEYRRRGFNQSELLAREFAKETGLPLAPVLEKTRETARQAGLDARARARNLERAFRVTDRAAVKGKRIVLVDDVLTTGATLSEIAARLKGAGAAYVAALTVCSPRPFDPLSTKKSGFFGDRP